ncbi:MAG: hypothetical protein U1E65_09245 [Myxococcota bacterium]
MRRRTGFLIKNWVLYRLDQFVGWGPLVQLSALILATALLVFLWSLAARILGLPGGDFGWWALTRFMDGGTMAQDAGVRVRILATGVTASGILLLSLVIGAVSSKLSERIDDLRQGKSMIAVRDHLLVLGFDGKVPLIARELARSHQRLTLVTLAQEDKQKQEAMLRPLQRVFRHRVRTIPRTGDPRSELALYRVAADRARRIVVIAPGNLDDQSALRWTLSTLLAIRRVTAPRCHSEVLVEVRRAAHIPLLSLAGEAGLAGHDRLEMQIVASDDIVARVLAQAIRHGAIYLALRELMSFAGSEFYLEAVPPELVGLRFDEAHARVREGILVGLVTAQGEQRLAPSNPRDPRPIEAGDKLIVLEEDRGTFRLGGALPPPPSVVGLQMEALNLPQTVAVLGANRTLPCLIRELDEVMAPSSVVRVSCPKLSEDEHHELDQATQKTRHVRVERTLRRTAEVGGEHDPALAEADGVVILGCEDEADPDGDASAIALLLGLRHARRSGARTQIRRLITEVRDPIVAHQIVATLDDLLVSTDVVALMLAQAALDPHVLPIYREILNAGGVELYVRPRAYVVPEGPATFGDVMSAARQRGDVAIGFYVDPGAMAGSAGAAVDPEQDEPAQSVVTLNPPRNARVPEGRTSILVMSNIHP